MSFHHVFITGVAGFIGSNLADRLLADGVQVTGWDNLSSKGLLYHKPAMMGVWGEQNRTHGITIQDMPAERVHVVGAPHYEYFRNPPAVNVAESRKALGLPPEGLLILFAGTMRLFDETDFLKEIDAKIFAHGWSGL